MEKDLADALMDFYKKILKPEFDALKDKNAEHDERFSELLGHMDAIYHRLGRLEDEVLMINSRLKRLEDAVMSGATKHADLENRIKDMKEQLSAFQSRLESVERQLVVETD